MKKKSFISIGVILIILAIATISVFAVPTLMNLKDSMKLSKYDSATENIINGAKSKYSANINDITSDGVVEYSVKELIKEGYLTEQEINPVTNEPYNENDKVLVITKNGYVTYKFVSGTTLLNSIQKSTSITKQEKLYCYKGNDANNYITFNEELYRIIMIDANNNILIINNENEKKLGLSDITNYLETSYNDKYSDYYKNMIVDKISLLDINTYNNTLLDGNSFIDKNSDMWITDNDNYKILDGITKQELETYTGEKAYIRPIIKLDYSLIVEKGNGTRLNPYVVSK